MNENKNMKDLSDFSHPISSLFNQPQSPEEWLQYILSKDQIESYKKNGYLSGIKILTEEQVDFLNQELANLTPITEEHKKLFYLSESNESENPEKVLFHAIGGWRTMTGFHDLLWSPAEHGSIPVNGGRIQIFSRPVIL